MSWFPAIILPNFIIVTILLYSANTHEAEFTKSLCRYFLQQGYDASRITILTGYAGQLIKLKSIMPKKDFEGVRVTVVDNFQGEENDIIILSLVRSNSDGMWICIIIL